MSYEGQKRRCAAAMMCASLVLFTGGCRHRVRVPVTPIELRPVEMVDIPEPDLPMIAAPKAPELQVPIAAAAAELHRERRRSVRTGGPASGAAPQSSGGETEDAPEDSAVGDLSAGGESTPLVKQEAEAVLRDNDRRLRGMPENVQRTQRLQVNKVKNFQRQARQALMSSDFEGAKTLAVKAKLLLDDLEK